MVCALAMNCLRLHPTPRRGLSSLRNSQNTRCTRACANGSAEDYNVVITGSTKGIGLALARRHLEAGDNVVICSRNDDAVKAVVKEFRDRYGKDRVVGRACNVCKASDVKSLAMYGQDSLGSLDIWINNAGTNAYSYKPLIETSENDLADIVDTNVLGVMLCCQAAIQAMAKQSRGGHIFNMDGAGSDGNPTPRFAAYGATKRSLAQLTKSLQAELKLMGIENIGIHNLSPGMVTTDLLMSGADTQQAKFFINALAETPDVVADYLVPKVRSVPTTPPGFGNKVLSGTYIKFLTPIKAYTSIAKRLITGSNKNRYVSEE